VTASPRGLAVSRRQCCDILGWTPNTFDKAVREGMPVAERPSGRGTDYVVFMGDVIRWIVERELRAAGHEPSEVVKLDLNAERARLAKEQADKTAIENATARGELLPVADVRRTYETLFTSLRDRVLAVRSTAPLLVDAAVGEGLPKVRALLTEALTQALDETGALELEPA
jgi:phage terminase Nu1 subunit (DNA packaging protein)